MNDMIRLKARNKRIPLWEIAERIGISEATISRWMRVQLSEEKESRILKAMEEITEERKAGL